MGERAWTSPTHHTFPRLKSFGGGKYLLLVFSHKIWKLPLHILFPQFFSTSHSRMENQRPIIHLSHSLSSWREKTKPPINNVTTQRQQQIRQFARQQKPRKENPFIRENSFQIKITHKILVNSVNANKGPKLFIFPWISEIKSRLIPYTLFLRFRSRLSSA